MVKYLYMVLKTLLLWLTVFGLGNAGFGAARALCFGQ